MFLENGDIILRPFAPGDRERLAHLADNPRVVEYLSLMPSPYTLEEADAWIDHTRNEHPRYNFAITVGGEFTGGIGLIPGAGANAGTAEVGYWLGEPYWGKKIASRALAMLCEYAFHELLFIRLQTLVFPPNAASARVLEKCGFYREAILRKHLRRNGRIHDALLYARLRNPD